MAKTRSPWDMPSMAKPLPSRSMTNPGPGTLRALSGGGGAESSSHQPHRGHFIRLVGMLYFPKRILLDRSIRSSPRISALRCRIHEETNFRKEDSAATLAASSDG